MNNAVERYLTTLGYKLPVVAYQIIAQCDDWYRAKVTDAHRRQTVQGAHYTLERMGFAARAAADDANLCEVVEVNPGEQAYDTVRGILKKNRFDSQFRKQLELCSAEGTAACYVRLEDADVYDDGTLRGGEIRLNYVEAARYIPLRVVNGQVIEAAFYGTETTPPGVTLTTLVMYTLTKETPGAPEITPKVKRYACTVRVFDDQGKLIPERSQDVLLGTVKPFAVLQTAMANPIENMEGFGYPKIYPTIPILACLDAGFTALKGDIETSEKLTLINEALCKFDDAGRPIPPNEQMKRRFVSLGEKMPQEGSLVHEITPDVRIEKFRDVMELLFGLLSQSFGYGSKKYSLDKSANVVQTATQYVGERQDMLLELNRQRQEAREYITDIVHAILYFVNAYQGGSYDTEGDVLVDFDDSLVNDRETELAGMRSDILAGIGGAYVRQQYLMKRYNLDEKEAAKWAATNDPDFDETEE